MNSRVDFSNNATVYDRRHGAALSMSDIGRLKDSVGLRAGSKIVDIGAGTGRVAVPLSAAGFQVIAAEPSEEMLKQLRAKGEGLNIETVVAEGSALPLPSQTFDAAVIARLLYLTPDWRNILLEARRVLKPGGVLLHEWANGDADEIWVQIREKARELFEEAGVRHPFHPGARSEGEIEGFLYDKGFTKLVTASLGPGQPTTPREFMRRLVEGELSYTWNVPQDVRESCLPELQTWATEKFPMEAAIVFPREVSWSAYCSHVA
jgi:SAM-dependent methyltransferase